MSSGGQVVAVAGGVAQPSTLLQRGGVGSSGTQCKSGRVVQVQAQLQVQRQVPPVIYMQWCSCAKVLLKSCCLLDLPRCKVCRLVCLIFTFFVSLYLCAEFIFYSPLVVSNEI